MSKHLGHILFDHLARVDQSPKWLAEETHMTGERVACLLEGTDAPTPFEALRIDKALNTPGKFLLLRDIAAYYIDQLRDKNRPNHL